MPRRPSSPVSGGSIVPPAAWTIGSAANRDSSSLKKRAAAAPILVSRARQADTERQAIVGLDAGRLRQHGLEASQRQAGADEQQRRQRDLDDDQTESQRAPQADRTAAAFLERLGGIFAHQVPRRQRTRQQSGDEACDERECSTGTLKITV